MKRYNLSTSPRQPNGLKRYAELIGNYKKQRIKSLCDNKLDAADSLAMAIDVLNKSFYKPETFKRPF